MLRTLAVLGYSGGVAEQFSFVTIGDWGGVGLGGYHATNEKAVAAQMGKTAAQVNAKFVINTGDNFYYCGVQSTTDAQWKEDFEDVFTAESLMVPWYNALGNHDYAYSVENQLQYKSPNKDRWKMPARYYSERIQLSSEQYATFVFLDTNPCVKSYRADDPSGWDPCSGQYGDECQGTSGTCKFHEHIIAQDCSAQLTWLESTLAKVDPSDWLIGVGHHPAKEINVEDLIAPLLKANMKVYFNGHTHELAHYNVDNRMDSDFITTGAGCMVHTHDQDMCSAEPSHSEQTVYRGKVSGFTVHTFSSDFTSLSTDFVGTDGKSVHKFVTSKTGPSPAPPAPPSPTPTPGTHTCQSYGCGKYVPSHPCQCNDTCSDHGDCCADYDKVCGKKVIV